ncbi:MAG: choice-of-anchor L domain-containing protein [Flavobacteriales bacterium]
MMKTIMKWVCMMAIATLPATGEAQLTINNNITLDEAITLLLGPDVEFSNVTFSGLDHQRGQFDVSTFDFGFNSGLILGSGDVAIAPGPNAGGSESLGGGVFGATDADLDALDGLTHNDAVILEFDFVATGSTVSFNYRWSSDEYPEFSGADADGDGFSDCGDVSDVFGFFLSGPGISGTFSNSAVNIALIPGSSDFVSIKNLNGGCTGTALAGALDCNYCEYYVDNNLAGTTYYNDLGYDGLTTILVATYGGLECGATYHIKLAVADVSDTIYDSAVFLEAGSFEVTGTLIEANAINPNPILGQGNLLEGCTDGQFIVHPPSCLTDPLEIILYTEGTATQDVDYTGIPPSIFMTGTDVLIPFTTVADGIFEDTETITVYFIYTNSSDELDTATATINLVNYELPSVQVEDVFICGSDETVTAVVTDGFAPFQFSYSSGEMTPDATYSEGDAGFYDVTVIDYCLETATDNFEVLEPEPLVVLPAADLCLGVATPDLAEGGGLPYTFIFNVDSLNQQGNDDSFMPLFPGIYEIQTSDQCGDMGTTLIVVEVCDTKIPNVFTPNSDGVNDSFEIDGIEGFPNSEVIIFNRWGNVLFESSNYQNTWTGKDSPDGVYYYVFNRSDGESFEGYVHVIR